MSCADTRRLLDAYADGELDLPAAMPIEAHLESCTRCRREFDALRATRAALGRACAFRPAPGALAAKLRAELRARHATRVPFWRSPLAVATPGILALVLAGWLAIAALVKDEARLAPGATKVVYHISSSERSGAALRNLKNHLDAEPDARIVVVAHNEGIDFLLRGARDETGGLIEPALRHFQSRGVEFRVCNNTLVRRQVEDERIIEGARLVPSGIAEIGRLQSREGYIYMRL